MQHTRSLTTLGLLAVSLIATTAHGGASLDPALKDYQKVSGIAGNLSVVGSDTLNNMMAHWAEGFQAIYPNVKIQIEGKGSSTAPPALIEGTAQLGPMSRPMKESEINSFVDAHGYEPTMVQVGLDAVAVFINKDNPLEGIDMKDLDAVFSSTYKKGGTPVDTWGDLGIRGGWQNQRISVYGRNSASGTYSFYKKVVMADGDYKDTVKEQPGSSAVVQGIASDLYGIGYSGLGYRTSGVKTLAIREEGSDFFFHPTFENAMEGNYPLARFLLVYVNKSPTAPMDPLTLEFFKYVLSRQGQEVVLNDGYFPLPAQLANQIVANLSN